MSPRLRLALLCAAVVAAAVGVTAGMPHSPQEIRGTTASLGPAAAVVFAAAWAVLTPALVSGPLMAAAAGLLFGTALGTPVAIAGATAGGLISFALARRFGARAVQDLCGPRLTRIQDRIERRGLMTVIYARAAPGVPASLLNYAAGLSRVRRRDFALGTLIGGAPRIFAYTALGGSAGHYGSPAAIAAFALIGAMALAGAAMAIRSRLGTRPA